MLRGLQQESRSQVFLVQVNVEDKYHWRVSGSIMKGFPEAQTMFQMGTPHIFFISASFHGSSISNFQVKYVLKQISHVLLYSEEKEAIQPTCFNLEL